MPIKYIGRKTDFLGKPLWEIVGNLRDRGIGRIVVRQMFQRYPEISYMKILKVGAYPEEPDTDPMQKQRRMVAIVDRVFRGRHMGITTLDSVTYKADYILIPKEEEHLYLNAKLQEPKKIVMPREAEFPPLLREYLMEKARRAGQTNVSEPKCRLKYAKGKHKLHRIAEEGETPDIPYLAGIGKPVSPNLFENIIYPEGTPAEMKITNSEPVK